MLNSIRRSNLIRPSHDGSRKCTIAKSLLPRHVCLTAHLFKLLANQTPIKLCRWSPGPILARRYRGPVLPHDLDNLAPFATPNSMLQRQESSSVEAGYAWQHCDWHRTSTHRLLNGEENNSLDVPRPPTKLRSNRRGFGLSSCGDCTPNWLDTLGLLRQALPWLHTKPTSAMSSIDNHVLIPQPLVWTLHHIRPPLFSMTIINLTSDYVASSPTRGIIMKPCYG